MTEEPLKTALLALMRLASLESFTVLLVPGKATEAEVWAEIHARMVFAKEALAQVRVLRDEASGRGSG